MTLLPNREERDLLGTDNGDSERCHREDRGEGEVTPAVVSTLSYSTLLQPSIRIFEEANHCQWNARSLRGQLYVSRTDWIISAKLIDHR